MVIRGWKNALRYQNCIWKLFIQKKINLNRNLLKNFKNSVKNGRFITFHRYLSFWNLISFVWVSPFVDRTLMTSFLSVSLMYRIIFWWYLPNISIVADVLGFVVCFTYTLAMLKGGGTHCVCVCVGGGSVIWTEIL